MGPLDLDRTARTGSGERAAALGDRRRGVAAAGHRSWPNLAFWARLGLGFGQKVSTPTTSTRGSARGFGKRNRAHDVDQRRRSAGERLRRRENEIGRDKETESILTTTRTFGAEKTSRGNGGLAARRGAPSSAMAARELGFGAVAAAAG